MEGPYTPEKIPTVDLKDDQRCIINSEQKIWLFSHIWARRSFHVTRPDWCRYKLARPCTFPMESMAILVVDLRMDQW
jgi:hypothetical protein